MKKPLVVSLLMAVMLLQLIFTPAYSQSPTSPDTPTLYNLVPGTYVNGYPRFTIHYPKDWVERRPAPQDTFRAGAPGPVLTDVIIVAVVYNPVPLEKLAAQYVAAFRGWSTEVAVVSDKSSQLRDGTPAREIELKYLRAGAYKSRCSRYTTRMPSTLNPIAAIAYCFHVCS